MDSRVCFENIRENIAIELKRSQESILLAVAWFTDSYLAKILIDKAHANIDVKVMLVTDEINQSDNGINFEELETNGVEIIWVKSGQNGLMHHKFCIIDTITCITGSYNWTSKAANHNLENIIISHDKKLIAEYSNQFFQLYNQYNDNISLESVLRRLKIIKAILLDGSKEEIVEQSNKLKMLLRSNIKDATQAKKEIFCILNGIDNSSTFTSIKRIDKFISTDWAISKKVSKPLLIPFKRDSKWGLRDHMGNVAVGVKFDQIWCVTENLIAVKQNDRWGCVDRTGKIVIPNNFDSIKYLKDGIVCLRKDKQEKVDFFTHTEKYYGLYSFEGKQLTPFKYWQIPRISEEMIVVSEGLSKEGFIDFDGKEIAPCVYDSIGRFKDGSAYFQRSGLWGFIDKTGKEIIAPKYEVAFNFGDGKKVVEKEDKRFVIDIDEHIVIPERYINIGELYDGLSLVYKGSRGNLMHGYIDKDGNEVIPLIYNQASQFINGLAKVRKGKKFGVIDKTGTEVIPFKYDSIHLENEIGFEVSVEGKKGYINRYNQEIIPIIYDQVCQYAYGIIEVRLDKKWGVVDSNGDVVIPINYDFEERKVFEKELEKVLYNGCYYLYDKLEHAVNLVR